MGRQWKEENRIWGPSVLNYRTDSVFNLSEDLQVCLPREREISKGFTYSKVFFVFFFVFFSKIPNGISSSTLLMKLTVKLDFEILYFIGAKGQYLISLPKLARLYAFASPFPSIAVLKQALLICRARIVAVGPAMQDIDLAFSWSCLRMVKTRLGATYRVY